MSPSMMAIMATGLIFPVALWWVFCGWVGIADIDIELGKKASIARFPLGIIDEAIAPSNPGFVGPPATFLHAGMGDPQRIAFLSKANIGNAERVFSNPATMQFIETLKVCRFRRFKPVKLSKAHSIRSSCSNPRNLDWSIRTWRMTQLEFDNSLVITRSWPPWMY